MKKAIMSAKRIRLLKDKGLLHVVHVTEEMEESAWAVFEKFNRDKFWSFTDCTSKVIMELFDIKEISRLIGTLNKWGF
jgi:predicted nucleic acid-binding protein